MEMIFGNCLSIQKFKPKLANKIRVNKLHIPIIIFLYKAIRFGFVFKELNISTIIKIGVYIS